MRCAAGVVLATSRPEFVGETADTGHQFAFRYAPTTRSLIRTDCSDIELILMESNVAGTAEIAIPDGTCISGNAPGNS